MSKVLVISDTHINPATPENGIWAWAGLAFYCIKHKPDYIVHLGDVADLDSQAWLVKNRGKFTLEQEIGAIEDCLINFHGVLDEYNAKRRKIKMKMYNIDYLLEVEVEQVLAFHQ